MWILLALVIQIMEVNHIAFYNLPCYMNVTSKLQNYLNLVTIQR